MHNHWQPALHRIAAFVALLFIIGCFWLGLIQIIKWLAGWL